MINHIIFFIEVIFVNSSKKIKFEIGKILFFKQKVLNEGLSNKLKC